jgi:hypothetical protein
MSSLIPSRDLSELYEPIERSMVNLMKQITDLEWDGKDATHLWEEYKELREQRDRGEKYVAKF